MLSYRDFITLNMVDLGLGEILKIAIENLLSKLFFKTYCYYFTSFALSFAILSLYISLYIISFCTMRTRDVLKYIDIQQKL